MLGKVTNVLEEMEGFPGMTVTDVRGFGRRTVANEEDAPLEDFIDKVRIEIVAHDETVQQIVDAIVRVAHTGNQGDGKVFVWPVDQAMRIRTGDANDLAI
jgi:nitrogen regulatory protein P-II 1